MIKYKATLYLPEGRDWGEYLTHHDAINDIVTADGCTAWGERVYDREQRTVTIFLKHKDLRHLSKAVKKVECHLCRLGFKVELLELADVTALEKTEAARQELRKLKSFVTEEV